MRVSEKIFQEVSKLPESLQDEVLDFVQYLASKVTKETEQEDRLLSTDLSLSLAMRGMETENGPDYSISDLKQVF